MNQKISEKLFSQAKELFPGGVNSPVRAFKSVGGTPLFISKGEGCYIWDEDGNKFIDFCGSWGPLIHGHADGNVVNEINRVAQQGLSFGAPNKYENELGSLIINNHRFIEKIRFVNSGTEAVMSAIRLARGYTKRNKIIKFEGCYHGHSDSLLVKAGSGLATFGTSSSAGVPESVAHDTIVLPLDDEKAVKAAFDNYKNEIACVIIEPVPANNGLLCQRPEYLKYLREVTSEHGSLLIFDEVITGFRIQFEGAAGYYNIQPDLMTYGKIIGGGLPVGAYAGSEKIMKSISPDGNVYQAGTLSGNPMAMAAGIIQLRKCLEPGFYHELNEKAKRFFDSLNGFFVQKNIDAYIHHIGGVFWMNFNSEKHIRSADQIGSMDVFNSLYHKLLESGIYLGPSGYEVGFVSAAHSPEILNRAFDKMSVEIEHVCLNTVSS